MSWPRVDWVSERHLRVAVGGESSPRVWGLVRAAVGRMRGAGLAGLVDVTPAYATVVLEFDVAVLDASRAEAAVGEALRGLERDVVDGMKRGSGRVVEIPVCYEGEYAPDIGEVARLCGMTEAEVARVHAGGEYVACFVGFQPGFAYLGGLPAKLATARLERPRVRVPVGSVGIAGEQTGVYPFASPGGWRLIGRTLVRMFDAGRERAGLVEMGDRVRFVAVDGERFRELEREGRDVAGTEHRSRRTDFDGTGLCVVDAGMLTTVQDLGRPGHVAEGVARGGAADPVSLRMGNRLVGNEDGAAGLEMTLTGVAVEFEREALVAVTGGEVRVSIDGVPVEAGRAHRVGRGGSIRVGAMVRGARAYLCVAGGVQVPRVMGSASTHLGAGFGGFEGRALRRGDRLAIGGGSRRGAAVEAEAVGSTLSRKPVMRVIVGANGFSQDMIEKFLKSEYRVAAQSDRVGLRLEGPAIAAPGGGRMLSEGMMWGAVQVPEDGRPIVLMCDHPTTGGYPVIACVAGVDLPRLGQLRPGEVVRFEAVSVEEARALWRAEAAR